MSATMFVKNNQSGPTVFDEDDFALTWKGAGDPNGEDILPVPAKLAESFAFHRALYLGVLKVVEAEPDVEDALDGHRKAWARQEDRRNNLTLASTGQVAEEGAVPREFSEPAPYPVGPGAMPKTLPNEVGVITEDGEAKPKIKNAKIIMGQLGTYY
jgi:hypothetical protein